MGHVGLQGQRCSILGPEHGKRTDDASGTQELRHLGRSQSDRHLLRHGLRGYEGADLELSYFEMKSRGGKRGGVQRLASVWRFALEKLWRSLWEGKGFGEVSSGTGRQRDSED
jgi:hypothetical protein